MSYTVTPDSIIGDILDTDMDTAPYFFEIGMHCLGCPASRGESIADACAVDVHAVDVVMTGAVVHLGFVSETLHRCAQISIGGHGPRVHAQSQLSLAQVSIHAACADEELECAAHTPFIVDVV